MTVDQHPKGIGHPKSIGRWVAGFIAVLVVGLLGSTAFGSLAHAASPADGDSPVAKAEYGPWLEDNIGTLTGICQTTWPNTFGWVWLTPTGIGQHSSPEDGIFVAFSEGAEAKVAELAEDFPRPDLLIPVTVKHSQKALLKYQDRIARAGRRASRGLPPLGHATNGWFSLDLDIKDGVVVLGFPKITKRIRATFRVVSRSKRIGIRMFETGYIRDDVETGRDWEVRLKKLKRNLRQTKKRFKQAKVKGSPRQARKLKRRFVTQRQRKQRLRREMLGLPWPIQPVRR